MTSLFHLTIRCGHISMFASPLVIAVLWTDHNLLTHFPTDVHVGCSQAPPITGNASVRSLTGDFTFQGWGQVGEFPRAHPGHLDDPENESPLQFCTQGSPLSAHVNPRSITSYNSGSLRNTRSEVGSNLLLNCSYVLSCLSFPWWIEMESYSILDSHIYICIYVYIYFRVFCFALLIHLFYYIFIYSNYLPISIFIYIYISRYR